MEKVWRIIPNFPPKQTMFPLVLGDTEGNFQRIREGFCEMGRMERKLPKMGTGSKQIFDNFGFFRCE